MNTNNYIQSGLLESYVLGTASEEEVLQVRKACEQYPEIMIEVIAIENSLIRHAEASATQLSSNVKTKLFAQLALQSVTPIVDNIKPINTWYKLAVAASITLLVGSIVTNKLLFSKLQFANEKLTALNVQQSKLQASELALQKTNISISSLLSNNTTTVTLKATDKSTNYLAKVYWNKVTSVTYISLATLPPPPTGKQYQLWAIVNGKPVDVGVFDAATDSLQQMKLITTPQAFAVTIENKGGSPTPTLNTMCLLGNV